MKQRMRRISALLLVALMCVSCMVPAFAAEGEGCPKIHTKSNCSYKQVGEPHEASCGEQGYTTYQCTECNTYFADDFVESADHLWQSVYQKPTCTADGFEKKICLNCGEEEAWGAEDGDDYKATGHTWGPKNGENCEEGVVCSVCGEAAKEIGDEYHVWGEPEVLKAPNHDEDGETFDGKAKVTCTVCGETKNVTIVAVGEHKYQVDEPKAPTCTVAGNVGGAKCLICGKVVHLDLTEHCTEEGCDHEDCDDEGCENAPYTVIPVIPCAPSAEWIVEAPTCTAAGKAYKACTMCGKAGTPVVLSPLGHNYQTRIYEVATTGGMTVEEIALYDAFAKKVAAGTSHAYTLYDANGKVLAEATVTVEDYVFYGDDEDLTAATASSAGENDDDAVRYVWTGEFKNVDPSTKDPAGNTYMHWGDNCSTETTSYRYVCTVCGVEEKPVSFVGHYWVEVETKAPECDKIGQADADGYTKYICANPNCDGLLEDRDEDAEDGSITYELDNGVAVKTVYVKAAHTFATETVEVTCTSKGYSVDKCACGAIDLTKAAEGHGKNEADELKDGWYDIVEIDPDAHDTKKVWIEGKEVTCEKDGYYNLVCKICDKTLETGIKVDALGHEADLDQKIEGADEDPTCNKPGYSYYVCKNVAEHGLAAHNVKVESKAKLDHKFTAKEYHYADCSKGEPSYVIIKCANAGCTVISPDFVEPTEFDKENPEQHKSAGVIHVTKGDCTTLDIVMYECNVCEYVWKVATDYVNEETGHKAGEGAGHTAEKQSAVAPTCTKTGLIEHYKCSVCDQLFADKDCTKPLTAEEIVVKTLTEDGKHPENKRLEVGYNAPTCTEKGNEEGLKCLLCGEMVQEATVIPALDHHFVEFRSNDANCTEWGYTWLVCDRDGCDEEKIVDYAPDFGGHDSETVKGDHESCCSPGLTDGERCKECGEWTVEQEVIAKAPHVNAEGEEFYGLCTDTVEDRVCVACEKGKYEYTNDQGNKDYVAIDCDGNHGDDEDDWVGLADGDYIWLPMEDAEALEEKGAHEWHVTYVPATCMSYSYTLVVCAHCGYDFITDEGVKNFDEHLFWGEWDVLEPATTITAGKKVRTCACGAKEELEIPALTGLEINVDLENGVKPGAALPNNGKVNVVVSTNASDLDVWGIRIELTYSGNIEYTDIVSKGANFANGEVTVHVDSTKKTITILATATTPTASAVENVNLDGEQELVTLQFSLKNAVKGDVVRVSAGSICEVNDKDQNKIAAKIVEEVKIDEETYCAASIKVTATSGNIVLDNKIDIDDAKALMLYITGANKEYNSAADMNQDGEVTATDYAAMRNALLGASN